MNEKYLKKAFALFSVMLVLSSCVTQKYQQPGIAVEGPLYRDTSAVSVSTGSDTLPINDTVSIASLPYTELFTDTVLQNLIAEGIRENLDVKTAVQRINEAMASFRQSKAAFWPGLDANALVTRNKQSIAALNLPPDLIGTYPLTTMNYQLGLSTSWEADIWGKLQSVKRASFATLLQTEAAKRAVQTQLVANIAGYYYQLLSLDQQLQITEHKH